MFKALIAICVVTQFNTNDGAVCYLFRDTSEFKSHLACMQNGDYLKQKMVQDFVKTNGNSSAVIGQAACVKDSTEAST